MSKRKHAKDVSELVYSWNDAGGYIGNRISVIKNLYNIPVRIVRESFYRKLIKCYEKYDGWMP